MNQAYPRNHRQRARKGAAIVFMAFVITSLVILSAFAINMAYIELSRTEMYISADAAVRAGGREFNLTADQSLARTRGRDLASRNTVAGSALLLDDADFIFGESARTSLANRYNFSAGGTRPNSLELIARRTAGSPSGAIPLLMPNIIGMNTFENTQIARATQVDVDVAIVLDRSGSMAYAATEPAVYPPIPAAAPVGWFFCDPVPPSSRWLDAVNAVDAFLAEVSNTPGDELVALATYSTNAVIDVPLTNNYANISSAMGAYTNAYCSGKTNIGDGISEGQSALASPSARPWASKVIIVLTDGIHNIGGNPVAAAQNAADQKILIFTITFALEADQDLMSEIASIGLGQHYHATGGANLTEIFRNIGRSLPILITR